MQPFPLCLSNFLFIFYVQKFLKEVLFAVRSKHDLLISPWMVNHAFQRHVPDSTCGVRMKNGWHEWFWDSKKWTCFPFHASSTNRPAKKGELEQNWGTGFKGKIWVPLGGYPSSCSRNITPYCPIQPVYNPYMWYMLVYISGTLARVPNFSLWGFSNTKHLYLPSLVLQASTLFAWSFGSLPSITCHLFKTSIYVNM